MQPFFIIDFGRVPKALEKTCLAKTGLGVGEAALKAPQIYFVRARPLVFVLLVPIKVLKEVRLRKAVR